MINKLTGLIFLLFWLPAQALTIEIFTNQQYPIDASGITEHEVDIYNLDLLEHSLSLINQQLKTQSPEQAKTLLHQWLEQDRLNLQQTMKGLIQAQKLGIHYLPAVVFDHKQVIYGQTNLQQAILEYHQWLSYVNTTY